MIRSALLALLLLWPLPVAQRPSSPAVPAPQTPGVEVAKSGASKRLNINQASLEQLKTLPGIGEVTAQRIVDYRKKNPPFRRVEELLIIRGISRSRLERIRNQICVE
jgi:competence protein ComEA